MKNFKYDKKYLYWGVTALLVIIAAIICNNLLSYWGNTIYYANLVIDAVRPVIFGAVFAYVGNPLMKIYEKWIFMPILKKLIKKEKRRCAVARALAIFLTLITAIAIVTGLLLLIIPELYVNIQRLVTNMRDYVQNGINFLMKLSEDHPEIANYIMTYYKEITDNVQNWAKDTLLPNANSFITSVSGGIFGTLQTFLDVIIGIIVSIYILTSKEHYGALSKKMLFGFLKEKHAKKTIAFVKYTDQRFGGFLVGKIVDSAIIAVLCFIAFSIFRMPYVLLLSVIIGVTNVIPFFGPFIGAIPCGLLVLLVNPLKAITFAVLVLVIQQIDGNIIGPKILGERTGLDSLGVIFAILFAGGLFGVIGMIVGVPLFAVIFGIIGSVCDKRLKEKALPTECKAYEGIKDEAPKIAAPLPIAEEKATEKTEE